jgi:hypothetical protein
MREIHEFWANILQIGVATWLLSKQIGYAAAGPIIVSVLSLLATLFVSPLAGKYQVGWLEKTQKRVGKSYMLSFSLPPFISQAQLIIYKE